MLGPQDSPDAHVEDTLIAGGGLCHRVVAEICANEGPARVLALADIGVVFDKKDGSNELDLTLVGGHSARARAGSAEAVVPGSDQSGSAGGGTAGSAGTTWSSSARS